VGYAGTGRGAALRQIVAFQYSLADTDCATPKKGDPRISLRCDDRGHWILDRPDRPLCQFPDFEAALDRARHAPDALGATIDVWHNGDYICCLPPGHWLRGPTSRHTAAIVSQKRPSTNAERYANRIAEIIFATAGPVFWLALVFVAIAASLGWRLDLL